MTREDQQVESVKTVSSLVIVDQPVAGLHPGPLSVQPSIMAVDAEVRQNVCHNSTLATIAIHLLISTL